MVRAQVEHEFALTVLLDFFPLLYYLAEAKLVQEPGFGGQVLTGVFRPMVRNLAMLLSTLLEKRNHSEPAQRLCPPWEQAILLPMYKCRGREVEAVLLERPYSFCAAVLAEILCKWENRWGNVGEVCTECLSDMDKAHADQAYQSGGRCKKVQPDLFCARIAEWTDLWQSSPTLSFLQDIVVPFCQRERPLRMPPVDRSILRFICHHGGGRCALPGCSRARCADGATLWRCNGGCNGLARYCSREHQQAHWRHHRRFCKREAS